MQAGSWMANAAKARAFAPSLTLTPEALQPSRQACKRVFHHLSPFQAAVTPKTGAGSLPWPHTDSPRQPTLRIPPGRPLGMPRSGIVGEGLFASSVCVIYCLARLVAGAAGQIRQSMLANYGAQGMTS